MYDLIKSGCPLCSIAVIELPSVLTNQESALCQLRSLRLTGFELETTIGELAPSPIEGPILDLD